MDVGFISFAVGVVLGFLGCSYWVAMMRKPKAPAEPVDTRFTTYSDDELLEHKDYLVERIDANVHLPGIRQSYRRGLEEVNKEIERRKPHVSADQAEFQRGMEEAHRKIERREEDL